MARVGGQIFVKVDGRQVAAKGNWTYNIGNPKNEMVGGADGIHGHTSMPQASKIEGTITDTAEEDVDAVTQIDGETITLELANGKTFVMREAVFTGDGDNTTEQGEVPVTFESPHKLETV